MMHNRHIYKIGKVDFLLSKFCSAASNKDLQRYMLSYTLLNLESEFEKPYQQVEYGISFAN